MKKILIAFLLLFSEVGYAQLNTDLSLPIGKSTFSIDTNQRINWNGSNFKLDIGKLKYDGTFNKGSQLHNFNFKLNDMYMSYASSMPKNTIGIKYRGFTFTSEDFTRNELQNVFSSKILVNNKTSLAYKDKDLSLSILKTVGSADISSYSLQTKNLKADYTAATRPLVTVDAWNRPIATSYLSNLQIDNLTGKFMDDYTDFQYKNNNFSLKSITTPKREENSFNYTNKNYSLSFVEFNDGYSKNFLNFLSKDAKFKLVNDGKDLVSQLELKDTTIAYGNSQSFIQSKVDDLEYRIANANNQWNYDFRLKNIGVRDGSTYGVVSPIKNLNIKASGENGVEQIDFNTKVDDTKVTLKYNNQFSIYDFYFRQNAFNIYENSFSMIGRSKTDFKDSFSLNLSSPKFSMTSDVINDLYSMSFRNTNNLTFTVLKDQKQNFLSLANTGKNINFGIQYNVLTNMFDRLSFSYSIKFK